LELNQSPGMPGTLFSQNYQGLLDNVMNGDHHLRFLELPAAMIGWALAVIPNVKDTARDSTRQTQY